MKTSTGTPTKDTMGRKNAYFSRLYEDLMKIQSKRIYVNCTTRMSPLYRKNSYFMYKDRKKKEEITIQHWRQKQTSERFGPLKSRLSWKENCFVVGVYETGKDQFRIWTWEGITVLWKSTEQRRAFWWK